MKKYKQQKAEQSEINFSDFCQQRKIEYVKLDALSNKFQRKKFLKDENSDCPDFWCKKNNQEIFVEVKTLTNLANEKIERKIKERTEQGLKERKPLINDIHFFPVHKLFNAGVELRGPLETDLKTTSSKFKNIKPEYNYAKILLLCDVIFPVHKSIFIGTSKKRGLFDKTGSNVSALVFWNKRAKRFNGIANPKARIEFTENSFNLFFGI